MTTRNSLKTLAVLLAVVAPALALADDFHRGSRVDRRHDSRVSAHVHGHDCNHDGFQDPRDTGYYETQVVTVWQPGFEERVWVEGQCFTKRRHHRSRTVCEQGHYESRWVAGRYVQQENRVWVAHRLPEPPPARVVYRDDVRIEPSIKVVFTGRL